MTETQRMAEMLASEFEQNALLCCRHRDTHMQARGAVWNDAARRVRERFLAGVPR